MGNKPIKPQEPQNLPFDVNEPLPIRSWAKQDFYWRVESCWNRCPHPWWVAQQFHLVPGTKDETLPSAKKIVGCLQCMNGAVARAHKSMEYREIDIVPTCCWCL